MVGTAGYALFWIGIRKLSSMKSRRCDWLSVSVPALLSSFAILTGFHLDNLLRATVFQGNSILFLIASASTLPVSYTHLTLPTTPYV